jgi:cell division transport system permease protein
MAKFIYKFGHYYFRHKRMLQRKKVLGSYPFISILFSIIISLSVIGIFGNILINGHSIKKIISKEIGKIQINVHGHLTDSSIQAFKSQLLQKPYFINADGKKEIKYFSPEDAKKEYIKQTGEDFTQIIEENPLRPSFIVYVNDEYANDTSSMNHILKELRTNPAVYEVVYDQRVINKIIRNINISALIFLSFALVLIFITILLINNTIRLAMYSQRFLIRSMQLVGAKSWFIIKPYILRSSFLGFIGGLITSAILYGLEQYVLHTLPELGSLQNIQYNLYLYASIIALGWLIGGFSAYYSVKKYLYLPLENLY